MVISMLGNSCRGQVSVLALRTGSALLRALSQVSPLAGLPHWRSHTHPLTLSRLQRVRSVYIVTRPRLRVRGLVRSIARFALALSRSLRSH